MPTWRAGGFSHHAAPGLGLAGVEAPDWMAVMDELPFGLVVLGPRQELRHENPACRRLTGWSIAEKGGVEDWLAALCPETGHREKVIASWREHIWRNQLTRTFTLRTPDQKLREIEFRSSLLRDGGITLTLDDVTDLRRSEERWRHGQLKFRALFTHTRTGTVLADRSGRIIDANPAFLACGGHAIHELRLSPLGSLLHPEDAAALAGEEESWRDPAPSAGRFEREVTLRTASGERRLRLTAVPVGEYGEAPSMSLHFFEEMDAAAVTGRLRERLRVVSDKARALLQAVPDLILLVGGNGIIVDLAPPPKPWPELPFDEGWKERPAAEVWPDLGELLDRCRDRVAGEGRTVHAGIRGPGGEAEEFSATLSPCGDGQILVVVRNLSERRSSRDSESGAESYADAALARPATATPGDRAQHAFRNQLQLVTSLFSLEPQGKAARDAFLKWQVRLRSLALAGPGVEGAVVRIFPLLRGLAEEVCSVVGRGPGRREVILTGAEDLVLDAQRAAPFCLLIGEWLRLALAGRTGSSGPALRVHLRAAGEGGFSLGFRPGSRPSFAFGEDPADLENLETLADQLLGRLEPSGEGDGAWVLTVPPAEP